MVLNPGAVQARSKKTGKSALISGAGATIGAGLASLFNPRDAEAGELSSLTQLAKQASKKLKPEQLASSQLEKRVAEAIARKSSSSLTGEWFLKNKKLPSNLVIPSLTGATALGAMALSPDEEASAMPRGIFSKIIKPVEGEVSSTASKLKGYVMNGKEITDVIKGSGNHRAILFKDGTQMTVTKADLHALMRKYGTEVYEQKFQDKQVGDRFNQAVKSMQYHKARKNPFHTRDIIRRLHDNYLNAANEMDPGKAPKTQFVLDRDGDFYTIPTIYADVLEKAGMLKVIRTKADVNILKKYLKD